MEAEAHGAPLLAGTIYGRAGAVDALRAHVDARRGGALALAGVAGIGKTRLALWAADYGREERRVVVEGRSVLGLAEPLGVVCDLVRSARRGGLEPPMRDPLAAGFPAQVLPELGAEAGGPATLGATFEAAARYLGALAGSRGALIVLEDLHWADATSVSLIPFLARALRGAPVRLLLTYRAGDDDRPAPALEGLRAEMRRSRLGDELTLGPLADDAAAAMLDEILGRPPAADVKAELLRLAGGNPFALEELARAVVESGWLDVESGRRRGTRSVEVPWTLAESIRARAERLDPADRELVAWAAAIGERFDSRLLIAASGTAPADVLAGMASLVRAGLVVEAPDDAGHLFAFRHALVHEALSQEGLAAQRRGRHERILAATERLVAEGTLETSAAELARHAMAAGDRERTLRYSRAAVARARELGAVQEAVEHLERALPLWTEDDGRPLWAELLFATGRLRTRMARGDERAVDLLSLAVEEYERLGDASTALWALSVLADARFEAGDWTQALLDWERSVPELRRIGPPEALRTALVGYSRGLALNDLMTAAADIADEGLALVPIAHDTQEASEGANLLITRGLTELARYREATGRPLIQQAIDLAIAHHDDVGAVRGHQIMASGQRLLLPVSECITRFETAAELVERHGLVTLQAFYLTGSAFWLIDAGKWAAAGRRAVRAAELIEGLERADWVRNHLLWIEVSVRLGRGELGPARDAAEALLRDGFSFESRTHGLTAQQSLATISLAEGDPQRAEGELGPYLELASASGDALALDAEELTLAVDVLVASGRRPEAAAIADRLERDFPSAWSSYCQAIAGPDEPATVAEAVEAAAGALEVDGRRWAAALMRVLTATRLSGADGERAAAVALARAAMERFGEMGSDAWVRRIEEMLRRMGARAPTRTGRGAGGLSGRELEVLALVAEGLTNRQIAERLVISEHTAVRHVANVFRKLGVGNRAAAVRLGGERGLITPDMASAPDAE